MLIIFSVSIIVFTTSLQCMQCGGRKGLGDKERGMETNMKAIISLSTDNFLPKRLNVPIDYYYKVRLHLKDF